MSEVGGHNAVNDSRAAVRLLAVVQARPHPVALVLGLVVLSTLLWGVRWQTAPIRASGDTFWYTRLALIYSGFPEPDATRRAAEFIVQQSRGTSPAAYVDLSETIDARYPAIFASRPLYPVGAAVFVPLAGTDAMMIAALVAGILFGVAIGGIAWWATSSWVAAGAVVMFGYALPPGQWLAFLYADGWMLVGWTLALGAASVHLVRGGWRSLLSFAAALALVALAKSANVAVLAAALVALAGVSPVAWRPTWLRAARLALVAVTFTIGVIVVTGLLRLPGLNETLQDYFTQHFSVPDVSNPVRLLLRHDLRRAPTILLAIFGQPLVTAVGLAGLIPLAVRPGSWPRLWIFAAAGPVLLVFLHPVLSEVPRLMAPAWTAVALGFGMPIAVISEWLGARLGSIDSA